MEIKNYSSNKYNKYNNYGNINLKPFDITDLINELNVKNKFNYKTWLHKEILWDSKHLEFLKKKIQPILMIL